MNTIEVANKMINTLINKEGLWASLSKFSNEELATIETYNHVIHIFKDGGIQLRDNANNIVKEYKTASSMIKFLINRIEG